MTKKNKVFGYELKKGSAIPVEIEVTLNRLSILVAILSLSTAFAVISIYLKKWASWLTDSTLAPVVGGV